MTLSKVAVADLRQAADSQEHAISEAKAQLQQLQGECQQLTSAWQGHASSVYLNGMNEFESEATKVVNILDQMQQTMVATANNFSQVTDNISDLATSTASGAGGGGGLGI
jgi:WXG100 family type VII secretion target